MLSIRHPPQNKRPTQTESEGWKKIFQANGQRKKTQGSNTYIRQHRFQNKGHKKRQRSPFHNSKGKHPSGSYKHCKRITLNIGATKYIRKILENFKKDIDSNTLIVGDFNTTLSQQWTDLPNKEPIRPLWHLMIH